MEESSRTRLGLLGASLSGVGAATLLAPDPGGDTAIWYVGSAAVLIGFAILALAWTRAAALRSSTRVGLMAAAVLGLLAATTDSEAISSAAGVVFGLAVTTLEIQLRAGSPVVPIAAVGSADGFR